MTDFDKWWATQSLVRDDTKTGAERAWDHQQERIEALEAAIKRVASHKITVARHSVMLHSNGARDDFQRLLDLVAQGERG